MAENERNRPRCWREKDNARYQQKGNAPYALNTRQIINVSVSTARLTPVVTGSVGQTVCENRPLRSVCAQTTLWQLRSLVLLSDSLLGTFHRLRTKEQRKLINVWEYREISVSQIQCVRYVAETLSSKCLLRGLVQVRMKSFLSVFFYIFVTLKIVQDWIVTMVLSVYCGTYMIT